MISGDHSNFIINKNKATALDVITLISYIKQKIRNEFNVQLQEEVQYLGF
jgi:UDP-N-acetylmuramate dehydrogenase